MTSSGPTPAGDAIRGPVRTCAGCQTRAPQWALLRLALVDGHVTADPRRRLMGRGAYVHRTPGCIERATRRGGLARVFRRRLSFAAGAWLEGAGLLEVGPGGPAESRGRPAQVDESERKNERS